MDLPSTPHYLIIPPCPYLYDTLSFLLSPKKNETFPYLAKSLRRCTLLFKNSFILTVVLEHRKVFPYFLNFVSSQTTSHKLGQRESHLFTHLFFFVILLYPISGIFSSLDLCNSSQLRTSSTDSVVTCTCIR